MAEKLCVVCGTQIIGGSSLKKKCSPECVKIFEHVYNLEQKAKFSERNYGYVKARRETEKGREQHRQEAREFYHKNRFEILDNLKEPHTQERRRTYLREWCRKNTDRVKAYKAKRKVFESDLTPETVQLVYEDNIKRYGTLTCYLCKEKISFGKDSLEHVIPLSRGGTNEYDNLEIAHQSCNYSKGSKTLEEYRIWQKS